MNKQSLATILGLALLGLAKKGSRGRIPLDDYFKKKTGNESKTFRIYFYFNYAPYWDNMSVIYDFGEYVSDFRGFIEEVNYFEPDLEADDDDAEYEFSNFCFNEGVAWGESFASDIMEYEEWKELGVLTSNSKLVLNFRDSKHADEFEEDMINSEFSEAKWYIESNWYIENSSFLDSGNEWWEERYRDILYEEGSIGNLEWDTEQEFDNLKESILHQKEELIDLLEENKNELFGHAVDWSFDWNDEVSSEAGYASGYLEGDFNIATVGVKLDTWIAYINKVLELAYEFWIEERPRDAFNEGDEISDIKVSKLEPDIWKSGKKSRLRRR